MTLLSRWCAALREFPTDFFSRHPRYRVTDDGGKEARFAEDLVFNRFRARLSIDTARRLLAVVDSLSDRGANAFDAFLTLAESMAGITHQPPTSESGKSRRSGRP